jgi:curved DNA-binding protein CbpA
MDGSDNAYELLGVTPTASATEIKTAYRKMALLTHPDKQRTVELRQTLPAFAKISNAYEILSDPQQRQRYNDQLAAAAAAVLRSPGVSSHTNDTNGNNGASYSDSSSSTTATHLPLFSHFFRTVFHDPFQVFQQVFREDMGADGSIGMGGDDELGRFFANQPSLFGVGNSSAMRQMRMMSHNQNFGGGFGRAFTMGPSFFGDSSLIFGGGTSLLGGGTSFLGGSSFGGSFIGVNGGMAPTTMAPRLSMSSYHQGMFSSSTTTTSCSSSSSSSTGGDTTIRVKTMHSVNGQAAPVTKRVVRVTNNGTSTVVSQQCSSVQQPAKQSSGVVPTANTTTESAVRVETNATPLLIAVEGATAAATAIDGDDLFSMYNKSNTESRFGVRSSLLSSSRDVGRTTISTGTRPSSSVHAVSGKRRSDETDDTSTTKAGDKKAKKKRTISPSNAVIDLTKN